MANYWLSGWIAEFLHGYRFYITLSPVPVPFPVCRGRGSCKFDLNRLPTTGYLGRLLNFFTASASTLLLHPFPFPFPFPYVVAEVHVRLTSITQSFTNYWLSGQIAEFLHRYHFYITASPVPVPVPVCRGRGLRKGFT